MSGALRKIGAITVGASVALSAAAPGFAQGPGADPFAEQPFSRGNNVSVRERPRPDYDPAGMPAGGFRLYPVIGLGYEFDDNVFADETNEESDSIINLRASARLLSQWANNALSLAGEINRREFSDLDDESNTTWRLGADGRLDIMRGFIATGGIGYADLREARGANDPLGALEPVEFDVLNSYASLSRASGRLRLGVRVDHAQFDFSDVPLGAGGTADQDFRDRDDLDVSGRADLALSPDTSVFVAIAQRWRDFDSEAAGPGGQRDFDTLQTLIGAAFDLSRLVRGEIGVGYVWTSFDDPALDEADGVSLRGVIEWFPTQITTVRLDAGRDVVESGLVGAPAATQQRAGVRVDHELRRNILINANVGYVSEDFEGIDREDERLEFGVGGEWLVSRSASVSARYVRGDQDSSGALRGRSFEDNVVSVGLTLRR